MVWRPGDGPGPRPARCRAPGVERVRALPAAAGAVWRRLTIIFVSGTRTDALDSVAGLLLGADDYITKPFDTGEFVARVRRCIERAGAGTNGAASGNGLMEQVNGLTPRELEVLQLLVDGLGTKAIAGRLVISDKTVATDVSADHDQARRALARGGHRPRAHRGGLVAEVEAHLLPEALKVESLDFEAADFDP